MEVYKSAHKHGLKSTDSGARNIILLGTLEQLRFRELAEHQC